MASNEDYITAVRDFNGLIRATFQLSVNLNKLIGDSRKQIASARFAKINLGALLDHEASARGRGNLAEGKDHRN